MVIIVDGLGEVLGHCAPLGHLGRDILLYDEAVFIGHILVLALLVSALQARHVGIKHLRLLIACELRNMHVPALELKDHVLQSGHSKDTLPLFCTRGRFVRPELRYCDLHVCDFAIHYYLL